MYNNLSVEERVDIGKSVREWIDSIGQQRPEFWEKFAQEIQERDLLLSSKDIEPNELTDEEGERFGLMECPFQQYKGIHYRAVPYEYLAFIVDKNKILEKYLKWRFKKGLR